MSGHVFHPGHADLHGMTVVVETHGTRTYVGRYDSQDDRGVHLLDVGVHDESLGDLSKADYLRKTARFGIRSEMKHLVLPSDEIANIIRLSDL